MKHLRLRLAPLAALILAHTMASAGWNDAANEFGALVDLKVRAVCDDTGEPLYGVRLRWTSRTPDGLSFPVTLRATTDTNGAARLRAIVNALTRIRLIDAAGHMDFDTKDSRGLDGAPPGLMPWFDHPARRTAGQPIAFGHWSTLGTLLRADIMALDSGCVWGGSLSALRVGADGTRELIQVRGTQECTPGGA